MDNQGIKQFGKNVYQTWKVFLWVLRWVSILVFGVLFFVGIYFKLPWKMLACLAIIPVVGIFVPRKIQPWVWWSLTLMIAALWGWVKLPEQSSSNWRPYEYSDELALIERNHFPADANNAADLYSHVLDEHGETIFYFRFRDAQAKQLTMSEPWDPNAYPFLNFWISEFDDAIEQFIEAGQIEQCRFEIPYTEASIKPQLMRLNQMKEWVRILVRSANRDLFQGQRSDAFEKLLTIPRMAQHLYQQQTLFDQSGAFDVELIGVRSLETFIIDHCENLQMLEDIEQLFAKLDPEWAGNWPDILLREKLVAKNLAGLMYEVNNSGRIRISHNALIALQAGLGYPPRRLFLNQHEMNRLAVIGLWLALPSSPKRLAAIVDDRFDYYSLQVQKGEQIPQYPLTYVWIKGLNAQAVIDWLAMQKVGYYWALNEQYKRHLAIVNQIHIFSAMKQYFLKNECWPKELEDLDIEDADYVLTDPLCNKPFVYELTEQGFRLYSRGPNSIDDGGINNSNENKDDILFWPRNGVQEDVVNADPIIQPDVEN